MRPRALISAPAGLAAIIVAVVVLIADGIALSTTYGRFINSGPRVTVPATVTLELEPGLDYVIYHEVTGSHVTVNRPLADLPGTMTVTLADAATNDPIEATDADWFMQLAWFGLRDRRDAVREFVSPPSGRITLEVAGVEPEQVFYVGPRHTVYAARTWPWIAGVALLAMFLLIGGTAALLIDLARRTRLGVAHPHS